MEFGIIGSIYNTFTNNSLSVFQKNYPSNVFDLFWINTKMLKVYDDNDDKDKISGLNQMPFLTVFVEVSFLNKIM